METAGIAIDLPRMDEQIADLAKVIDNAQELAFAAIGHEVNLGSPKQLQTVLFDELELPKTKKIKSGYTTDAASLKNLLEKTGHEFLVQLMAHRESSKLRQMLESLKKSVTEDGRIHTTYAQNVAATAGSPPTTPTCRTSPSAARKAVASAASLWSATATSACCPRTTHRSKCGSWRTFRAMPA
ncbi:DNA polymerase I [Arthrobacter sp. Hiyo4]|nr:DNA polymerase I [Arthrobacter sp. Hiyo4]